MNQRDDQILYPVAGGPVAVHRSSSEYSTLPPSQAKYRGNVELPASDPAGVFAASGSGSAQPHKLAALKPRRSWKSRFFRTLTSPPALFVFLTIILPGLTIGLRHQFVALIPQTTKLYSAMGLKVNLDGLELQGVTSVVKYQADEKFLLVSGKIVSLRDHRIKLPPLQLVLHAGTGQKVYSWQAPSPQKFIDPRTSIRFVARLDTPPAAARNVKVGFATGKR